MKRSNKKFFNGRRYFLNQDRWKRTTHPNILLSHDVWNYFHPLNPIKQDEVIHHINSNSKDDRTENLEKMKSLNHLSLHNKGENNPNYQGGHFNKIKYQEEYYKQNYIRKLLFSITDKENKFYYRDILFYNKKTNTIGFTHSWEKLK